MRHINLTNYAILTENKSSGYYSLTEADAVPAAAAAVAAPAAAGQTISILSTDSTEIKALKNVIINKVPIEVFNQINGESTKLAADTANSQAKFSVKIADAEYRVVINKTTLADGKTGIWIDYDSTAKLIEGLDLDYITTQLNRAADKTFLGIDFGTNEEKLASVAGAIYSYCYEKNASAKEVLKAIGTKYQERFGESMLTMIDNEFTGSPDVFARGLFGADLNPSDVSAALGVDAVQSLIFDLVLTVGAYAATALSGGAGAGAAAISTAKLSSTLKNVATLGRAGRQIRNLETAVVAGEEALTAAKLTYQSVTAAEKVASANKLRMIGTAVSLGAEEVNVLKGVKNFASIEKFLVTTKGGAMSLNGEKMAAEMAKDAPTFFQSLKELARISPKAVKQALSTLDPKTAAIIVGGAGLALDSVPDIVASMKGGEPMAAGSSGQMDDKKFLQLCDELRKVAKGYTGGDGELKIAFTMLSLTPATWIKLNDAWNKNNAEDGTLYDYCVSSELSGDLAVLVDGYLGGIAGVGDLSGSIQSIKDNLEKGAVAPAAEPAAEPVKESIGFTRLKTYSDFYKRSF